MNTHHSQKVLHKYDQGDMLTQAGMAAAASPPASPPSAASSPSHEFSFTISLHSSSTPVVPEKAKPPPSPFAIDLSPADDIFFHGHLLPLHLLSHLPVPSRSSTNSLDSFTLPITELMDEQRLNRDNNSSNNDSKNQSNDCETQGGRSGKNKSFSLFRLTRRRKACEVTEREDKEKHNRRRKIRFDVNHVLKKYVRMIRALPFFREKREDLRFGRQAYSFSGGLSSRNKGEIRGGRRRGEFSAPASMRTSPTNSGLLVATTSTLPSSASDSTMEELQAAIQAAIAHCKNSIAKEDKIKF